MDILEKSAKLIFDSLASADRKPKWEIQPEHIKDVFRSLATPSPNGGFKTAHHRGGETSWIIRGDGSVICYRSMTSGHLRRKT